MSSALAGVGATARLQAALAAQLRSRSLADLVREVGERLEGADRWVHAINEDAARSGSLYHV